MSRDEPTHRNSIVGGLLILLARGILLWLVVPIASPVWVFLAIRLRRNGITFVQYLGWVDLNLIALLQRIVFRPLVRWPTPYVPSTAMPSVKHRLRLNGPV